MATSPRSFVHTLITAIPAEDGASLMARAGEVARIMSSAGSVDVGGIALTSEAIDELCAHLLPPDQLETFRESGTGQGEFTTADGAGAFAVLAASTDGDRWIEVRRQVRAPQGPSEETLVAELLSRSFAGDTKAAASAPPPKKVTPQEPVETVAPVAAEEPVEAAAPAEAIPESAAAGHDLDVPANLQFVNDKFDADDLTVPGGLLDDPVPSAPATDAVRQPPPAKSSSPAVIMPPPRTFTDRLSEYGRLSILLPAIIVLVVGLPGAGWFFWMRHSTPPPVAVAPAIRPILKSRRLPNAFVHALVAPSGAPAANTQNTSAPAPVEPPQPPPPAASVARASGPGFAIQVAAVHERDEADRMAAKLVQAGYPSYVVNGDGAASGFYRVRVGAFPDRQAAEDVAKRIELTEGTKPWIVKDTR